ncbi:hypothetical protein RN001_011609 [Aquatica leii]|uniref:Sodium channel protein Nach n=1 Tax=Aquatica leii TaxID=1421715 RepID=A0AAN7P2L8_9COLE|nr:hypothetical protein RN001_011609 [Aquatica leii]
MWFCCVSIGAIATAVIIVSLWEKFQTNPTITGLDTDFHSWNLPFPAITVCQSEPSSKKNIEQFVKVKFPEVNDTKELEFFLEKLSLLSFPTLLDFKKYTTSRYVSNKTDLKKFIFEFLNPCEEIFKSCLWKSEDYDCCKGFYPVFTETGFCYSFNSRHYERKIPNKNEELPQFHMRYIKETDIKWSLKFEVVESNDSINFPVYIHNSDEIPGLDMQPQITWNFKVEKVAFSMKQTYTTDDTRQLSVKQRHCIFEDEVKLKIDHIYTYTACTRQCRMENSKKFCGCVPHFYSEIDTFRHCKITELSCIADHIKDIESIDRCSCHLGCFNTVYDVEKLIVHSTEDSDEVNRELEAEFVSWPMVRYKREVLFGWVDLLVSFGGIAGLFLGFSLLSGVELIYYFTLRACCMVYREPKELEKQQRQDQIKRDALKLRRNYDLSLVPYFIKPASPNNGRNVVAKKRYNNKLIIGNLTKVKPSDVESKNSKLKSTYPPPPFGIEYMP